jgi:hypothetical protein
MADDPARTPKQEAEVLMNLGLPFARKMLEEHGEFYPFGAAMRPDRTTEHVGVKDGREMPPSRDVLDTMMAAFRDAALIGKYRAVAAFVDVKVNSPGAVEKTDAVQICLEHVDGYFADVFAPYHLVDGKAEFAPLWAERRRPQVFANGDKDDSGTG